MLHVNSGETHCLIGRQPKMVGPGPVQFWKKKGKKILLEKTYNFSAYFSIKFCLILVCIFTP
jgi:hypothetical protein